MLKQAIFLYLLPLLIALASIYTISFQTPLNSFLFKPIQKSDSANKELYFIENFSDRPAYESSFLKSGDSAEIIYLLGSSELAETSDAIPYNFISQHFETKVKAVGHAGNQCLSIFAQLLANEERLANAPIVIILSPGWFESKPSKGTSSALFLEFNSERFLKKIISSNQNAEFNSYLYQRIADLYSEFTSPNLELKWMNFSYRASKSSVHQLLYSPILYCDKGLLKMKDKLENSKQVIALPYKRVALKSEALNILWDSLFEASKQEVISKSTNNSLGIADDYYTEFIHGKVGRIQPVNKFVNQELEDFTLLLKLLKQKKANASFIISPLNALYYKNLVDLEPTMDGIEYDIHKQGFPVLNLFETDKNKYNKALLHDVMHLSDYGWYVTDKFIVDTYKLNQ